MYHELLHAWDVRKEKVDYSNYDIHTDGEIRAHNLECELIKAWLPEQYVGFLKEAEEQIERGTFEQNFDDLLQRYFPLAATLENPYFEKAQGSVKGSLKICVVFERGRRSGQDLRTIYRNLTGRH